MTTPRFIIIDDDWANNIICDAFLTAVFNGANVKTFTDPRLGLTHLVEEYGMEESSEAVLFLDINMPFLTGWEVLARFDQLSEIHKKKIRIYMLSSSIDHRDITQANENKHVAGFVSKPLNRQKIIELQLGS